MKNKLAVILPIYINDKFEYFKLAFNSLINQSYTNFDIVIIKDGIIKEEINRYILRDHKKNIIQISIEKNLGLACALNKAIEYCLDNNYEYIARMDADDISFENRIAEQLDFLKKNPNYLMVGSHATIINDEGKIIGQKVFKNEINLNNMLKDCQIIHPSVMFKADFFRIVGYYNESLAKSQDYELWLRALHNNVQIGNIKKKLIFFRYEKGIIRRRRNEQLINIRLKKNYGNKFYWFVYAIPNILILLMPSFLIQIVLKLKLSLKRN